MLDKYDQFRFVKMIDTIMRRTGRLGAAATDLVGWIEDNGERIGLGDFEDLTPLRRRRNRSKTQVSQKLWVRVRDRVEAQLRRLGTPRASVLEGNLRSFSGLFGLDEVESGIVRLAAVYQLSRICESFFDHFNGSSGLIELLACALGATNGEVHERLNQDARLVSRGIIEYDPTGRHLNSLLDISRRVLNCLQPPRKSPAQFKQLLIAKPKGSDLAWSDFEHIGERDVLERVLRGAVKDARPGINILIYGPPGTGKTEFCAVLARKAGLVLYAPGESGARGGAPSRDDRLNALRRSQHLLESSPRSVVLFDEMEDLFERHSGPFLENVSRVHAHRLLESNQRPVLWTCNHIGAFDPAILRRMVMAVEIKCPPASVRERVWSRLFAKEGLTLCKEDITVLSREFEAPPALAASAVRAAKLAGGDASVIRQLVRGVSKAMAGGIDKAPRQDERFTFEPSITRTGIDMEKLTARLAKAGRRNFSLCLSGPPGTGKSAYARHLAAKLGIEVIQKRASDLLSMWVGESEKGIAAAFAEACDQGAMLVFDEADSLLSIEGMPSGPGR